jgi:hypothetical protein
VWKGLAMERASTAFAVVVLLVGVIGPARSAEEQHCASRLVPLEPVGGRTLAELDPIGCFATYDQALEAGSGTTTDVSADVTPEALTEQEASLVSTGSLVLIGTEFDGFGFGGDSQSYFAPSTCSSGVIWGVDNVGAEWNDRFQSGKGFGGCDTNKKFQHENFAGNVKTCTPNCADYGALANQVTSLRWRP